MPRIGSLKPRDYVERDFDSCIRLVTNLLITNKNYPLYLSSRKVTADSISLAKEHGRYIIEKLEDSKKFCADMTEPNVDPKKIEEIVRDHFYKGPIAGSTERLTKALQEYLNEI